MEEVYEDELVDAFDSMESTASIRLKSPVTISQYEDVDSGHLMSPNVNLTLYPTFDTKPNHSEVADASLISEVTQQNKEIEKDKVQLRPARMFQQMTMSEEELQTKWQQIERDMSMYQQRFDHVAQALARDTPHQIEERRKRKEEVLKRQEQRYETIKTRLERDLERLEKREEQRIRIQTSKTS